MNEGRLRDLLHGVPVPAAAEAERRGLSVASEAFAERQPPRRPALPRLAVALAAATLLAAIALSPAGAQVRGWIGDVFAGVPDARPGLTALPGGGRLLVGTPGGVWAVRPDGSRRLLGEYAEATWSPHGLFVAAASGRALSAVEPDGTPRWSLSGEAAVSDPRWSPSGFRIAYRDGRALRVVAGDGRGDALLDPRVAPLPAAWSPLGPHLLAYADAGGGLRVVDADTAATVGSGDSPAGIEVLEWSPDGSALIEASRRSLRLREVTMRKLASRLGLGPARRVPLPAGATIADAAFSPRAGTIAALLELPGSKAGAIRGEVLLIDAGGGPPRRLFSAPGRLSDLAWSPDGRLLLIAWRDADQWLFVPASGRGRVRAVAGISKEFAPGGRGHAAFPRIEGWCCAAGAPTM